MEQFIRSERFHDFGRYRQQLRCWDTEAVQLSHGPLTIHFDCLDAGDVILSRLKFDRDATLRSVQDAGWHTVAVCLSQHHWCGMKVQPGMFTTSPPQCETYVVSRQPFDAINVTVRCGTLANWDAPLADLAVENATTERSVCAGDPSSVDRFKTWVEGLFAAPLPACPDDESALWDAALRTRLRRHLSGIVGRRVSPRTMTSIHRVARYDLVWAALRVIRSETEHRLKVTDLASSVGVSVRALEYAFTSVIGSSPAQYLLAYRLNHARHSLMIQAARGGSVTAVALDHNFENLSRFAQHYSRLFGERPSETLRTARLGFGHA